jgi:hypothetical protein
MPKLSSTRINGESAVNHVEQLKWIRDQLKNTPLANRSSILNFFLPEKSAWDPIENPEWLEKNSSFSSSVWHCVFRDNLNNEYRKQVDFGIKLADGELLTAPKHQHLLATFKHWIYSQIGSPYYGGAEPKPLVAYANVLKCLHFIDFFLLNTVEYQLEQHGLHLVNKSDINIALRLMGAADICDSVYKSTNTLKSWLYQPLGLLSGTEAATPTEAEIVTIDRSMDSLGLSDCEIISCRRALLSRGFYDMEGSRFWRIRMKALTEKFYRNTLSGHSVHPDWRIFNIGTPPLETEYPRVKVRRDHDHGIQESAVSAYLSVLFRMGRATRERGYLKLDEVISSTTVSGVLNGHQLIQAGRYRSIPAQVVFDAISSSLDFADKYGEDILTAVARVFALARKPIRYAILNSIVVENISPKLYELGVRQWSASHPNSCHSSGFDAIRANIGLYDLYRVLIGSTQIVVGALMARRQGEMTDLLADSCLLPEADPFENPTQNFQLQFFNRKSGTGSDREEITRPIILAGARLIWRLKKFHAAMRDYFEGSMPCQLFIALHTHGLKPSKMNHKYFNQNFDIACDYFETKSVTINGNVMARFYIRQHQLRRFFAMVFFYGHSIENRPAVAWMLAHTDEAHLFNYISETVGGEVLIGVKAELIASEMWNKSKNIENLDSLIPIIKCQWNGNKINLKTAEEIENEIGFLFEDDNFEIKPQFSEFDDRKDYLEDEIYRLIKDGKIELSRETARVIDKNGNTLKSCKLVLNVKGTAYG